jgi:hypothetical protein
MACEPINVGGVHGFICYRGKSTRAVKHRAAKRCVRCCEQFTPARAADTICGDCATDLGG